MESKIKNILKKIDALNDRLNQEYSKLSEKYGFSIKRAKIVFLQKTKQKNKLFRIPTWKYVIPKNLGHFLSLPFIYMIIIPVVILDIFITIYQWVAFSLYQIPKVKRSEYIIFDRRFLDYLNIVQKVHCLYCSYANGIFAYALEIAARTERYWCPIKATKKQGFYHNWYKDFADYGNPEEWKEKFNQRGVFSEQTNKNSKN